MSKKKANLRSVNISKLANPKLKETKHDQHKSTRDTNTKSELSINTIKGIQADLNELFKEKGRTVFIFRDLKEYTNKAPQKNETQYLYKLSKKTILYYEFNKKNIKKTISFNIESFKFKEQKLNDKPHFIQEFLISFFTIVKSLSTKNLVFEEKDNG